MPKITLDEFCKHWTRDSRLRAWPSLLAKNAEDFATLAGEYAKGRFEESFSSGGFYGSGTKWAPRESRWGKKFTHPVMNDTGELKSKITGGARDRSYSAFGKRDYKRLYTYKIQTEESSVASRGKRGRKRGNNHSYAAVHNTDPKFKQFYVNQYSKRRPVHRQFIGHSPKILNHIHTQLVPLIFKDFPK